MSPAQAKIVMQRKMGVFGCDAGIENGPNDVFACCVERALRCFAFGRDDRAVDQRAGLKIGPQPVDRRPRSAGLGWPGYQLSIPISPFVPGCEVVIDERADLIRRERCRDIPSDILSGTPDWRSRRKV